MCIKKNRNKVICAVKKNQNKFYLTSSISHETTKNITHTKFFYIDHKFNCTFIETDSVMDK